jgi:hypothetical protein
MFSTTKQTKGGRNIYFNFADPRLQEITTSNTLPHQRQYPSLLAYSNEAILSNSKGAGALT